jgi:hypothetical protein
VPSFLEGSRSYARVAGLLALLVHLDRLEGRDALAAGEVDRGLELLAGARSGFTDLGAAWERARTELDLADALSSAGLEQDGRVMLEAAEPDLGRAVAVIELERHGEIRRSLG